MKILVSKSIPICLLTKGQIVVDDSGCHFHKVVSAEKDSLNWVKITYENGVTYSRPENHLVDILITTDINISKHKS